MSSNSGTVLVTGANGYAALHTINELLKRGYTVRGTVRSEKAATTVRNTFPTHIASKQLQLFLIQHLEDPNGFKDIIDSQLTGVIHTASPACYPVENVARNLLDPAIKGATGVSEAIEKFADKGTFKRVVHLSSIGAIVDLAKGMKIPGFVYTAADWNPVSYSSAAALDPQTRYIDAYGASKALSERAVWSYMSDRKPWFDVVCINPSLILGPHVERIDDLADVRSTARFLWSLVDAPLVLEMDVVGMVDARDLAAMMVSALEVPEASGKRFLVADHFDWQSVADAVREGLPELRERVPVGEPGTGREKAEKRLFRVDGREIVKVIGVGYRPLQETVVDQLKQFLEVGSQEKGAASA